MNVALCWDCNIIIYLFIYSAKLWAEKVGRLCTTEEARFLHYKFLCRDHFLPTDFVTPEGIHLNRLAVPCGLDSASRSIPQPYTGLRNASCEGDDTELLDNLHSLLKESSASQPNPFTSHGRETIHGGLSGSHIAEQVQREVNGVDMDLFLVAHVSGFIARYLLRAVRCYDCKTCLTSSVMLTTDAFMYFKEYKDDGKSLT
jgi:hypothetical protein